MSNTQPPCRGNTHYFGPPTGLHSGQVCSCGERYGETIDGKFRMRVTAAGSESIAGEVACTPGARYEASRAGTAPPVCCGEAMRRTARGASPDRPAWICSTCEVYQGPYGARTRAEWWRPAGMGLAWQWAQGTTYEAPTKAFPSEPGPLPSDLVSTAMIWAANARPRSTSGIPVDKAAAPEQLPAIRARLAEISVTEQNPPIVLCKRAEQQPLRPDGFAQSQVDAAKAVLLASVPRKDKL